MHFLGYKQRCYIFLDARFSFELRLCDIHAFALFCSMAGPVLVFFPENELAVFFWVNVRRILWADKILISLCQLFTALNHIKGRRPRKFAQVYNRCCSQRFSKKVLSSRCPTKICYRSFLMVPRSLERSAYLVMRCFARTGLESLTLGDCEQQIFTLGRDLLRWSLQNNAHWSSGSLRTRKVSAVDQRALRWRFSRT